jgi:hypothetical protein
MKVSALLLIEQIREIYFYGIAGIKKENMFVYGKKISTY